MNFFNQSALRLSQLLTIVLVALLLQACASSTLIKNVTESPNQVLYQQHIQSILSIQQFYLQGKIGIQTEKKGFSGSMTWQHDPVVDLIKLYSPLGSQMASIKKTSEQIILEDANGNLISAADAESLTLDTLGWQLPLSGLADWSVGRPTNKPIQDIQWNDHGQLSHLIQDGWDIEFDEYVDISGYTLPYKLYLRSPKVNIKLIIKQRDQTR